MPAVLKMATAAELKEFQEDFETVRAGLATARLHLKSSKDLQTIKATMKRTRLARLEVGRALLRMHQTDSWRDSYPSWSALCRKLALPRTESYELMNFADLHESLDQDDASRIPEGLSNRQIKMLRAASPEDRDEAVRDAAGAAGAADTKAIFARLSASLNANAVTELDEGEMPKEQRADSAVSWVRRQCTSLAQWFEKRGLGERAAAHIDALLQLAENETLPAA